MWLASDAALAASNAAEAGLHKSRLTQKQLACHSVCDIRPYSGVISVTYAVTAVRNELRVIFCGKQNISLSGQIGSHSNHGNFLTLVDFCLNAGDLILADHFKTCGHNT